MPSTIEPDIALAGLVIDPHRKQELRRHVRESGCR
jgi:hypothetical protein